MSQPRTFKLLVPPPYSRDLKVAGKVGARPNCGILGLREDPFVRMKIPIFIDNLTFTFAHCGDASQNTEKGCYSVRSIYHLMDFMVVSEVVRDFFVERAPGHVDFRKIRMLHSNGDPSDEAYFAIKVNKRIDCIDPVNSFYGKGNIHNPSKSVRFSDSKIVISVDECLSEEFSNADDYKYVSFPRYVGGVESVHIFQDRIPPDALIFEPTFWPGYLLIASDLFPEFRQLCRGTGGGHGFWMLDLDNMGKSHAALIRAYM